MTRRQVLAWASAYVAVEIAAPALTGSAGDLDFVSALDAAAAIKAKRVSSVELTRRTFTSH